MAAVTASIYSARKDRTVSDRRSALARQFPAMLHHDYRALWIAAGMSSATLWAMLMARAWIALELTDSGFTVGAVSILLQTFLPSEMRVFRDVFVFAFVIVVLVVRPQGLVVSRAAKERV